MPRILKFLNFQMGQIMLRLTRILINYIHRAFMHMDFIYGLTMDGG